MSENCCSNTRRDRKDWLDSETPISDDPRRVPVPPESKGSQKKWILEGGRVFFGADEGVRRATIVIEDSMITDVLDPDEEFAADDHTVLDVSDKTVLPGLIDLHTHLTYNEPDMSIDEARSQAACTLRAVERLRFYLESGITSIRDAGSHWDIPFRLKDWVRDNRIPGPRVFAAGCLITATGGHGAENLTPASDRVGKIREAAGADDWREAAREQFKKGADVIKVASHFSRQEIEAAVDEAHTLGLKVMCDAETFYIDWAVEAGVDTIEHPLPRTQGTIQKMADRGVQAVPTLIPYQIIFAQQGGYFHSTSRRFSFSDEDNLQVVKSMRKAGVAMGIGTDLVADWFRYLPHAYIEELRGFSRAGYGPLEVLEAATINGAQILDMDDRLGSICAGKMADILIVEGRPDEQLEDLRQVDMVFRDGYMVVKDGRVHIRRHQPNPLPW